MVAHKLTLGLSKRDPSLPEPYQASSVPKLSQKSLSLFGVGWEIKACIQECEKFLFYIKQGLPHHIVKPRVTIHIWKLDLLDTV